MDLLRNALIKLITDTLESLKNDSDYIQMRLLVANISSDFEKSLKAKIKQKNAQIKVREANLSDVDEFVKIYKETWKSTAMHSHPVPTEIMKRIIKDPHIHVLLMEKNKENIGFAIIHRSEHDLKIGIIDILGILPQYQGKGYGTTFGVLIWDFFKKKEIKELRCRVSAKNKKALSFITNLGFEVIY